MRLVSLRDGSQLWEKMKLNAVQLGRADEQPADRQGRVNEACIGWQPEVMWNVVQQAACRVSHYEMCNLMGKSHKNESLIFKEIAEGGVKGLSHWESLVVWVQMH